MRFMPFIGRVHILLSEVISFQSRLHISIQILLRLTQIGLVWLSTLKLVSNLIFNEAPQLISIHVRCLPTPFYAFRHKGLSGSLSTRKQRLIVVEYKKKKKKIKRTNLLEEDSLCLKSVKRDMREAFIIRNFTS